jgi:hypothetical protein
MRVKQGRGFLNPSLGKGGTNSGGEREDFPVNGLSAQGQQRHQPVAFSSHKIISV